MVLYAEHVTEPGETLGSFVLYPCTNPRNSEINVLGASLRWAIGSDNKYTEITKHLLSANLIFLFLKTFINSKLDSIKHSMK